MRGSVTRLVALKPSNQPKMLIVHSPNSTDAITKTAPSKLNHVIIQAVANIAPRTQVLLWWRKTRIVTAATPTGNDREISGRRKPIAGGTTWYKTRRLC